MGFFKRVQGTFSSPDVTFKALAEKPAWMDILLVALIGVLIFTYLAAPYLQKDQIQLLEDDVRFQDRYGEDQLERIIESRENPPPWQTYAGYIMAALGFVASLLISSLVILVLGRITSTPYVLLNQFDFFQLWMFGILALGLKYIFRVDLKHALFISYFFWFLKSLLNVGLSLLIRSLYL